MASSPVLLHPDDVEIEQPKAPSLDASEVEFEQPAKAAPRIGDLYAKKGDISVAPRMDMGMGKASPQSLAEKELQKTEQTQYALQPEVATDPLDFKEKVTGKRQLTPYTPTARVAAPGGVPTASEVEATEQPASNGFNLRGERGPLASEQQLFNDETGFGKAVGAVDRYAVQPFEALAQKGAEVGRGIAENALHVEPFSTSPGMESMGEATGQPAPPSEVGAARAVGSVVGSTIADPRNAPMAAGGFANVIMRRLMSMGFSALMAKGAIEQSGELGKIIDDQSIAPEDKVEKGTAAVLSTLMAAQAGTHAVLGEPSATEVSQHNTMQEGVQAMVESQQAEQKASRVAQGLPPEPPQPKPPIVTNKDVKARAEQIKSLPEEQQPEAIAQSHQELAQRLSQQGVHVNEDKTVEPITSPKQAASVAADIVNKEAESEKETSKPESESELEAARRGASGEAPAEKPVNQVPEEQRASTQLRAGDPVELQSGEQGKVAYVPQSGKRIPVTLENGKTKWTMRDLVKPGAQELQPEDVEMEGSAATRGPEATAALAREATPNSAKLPQAEQLENARVDIQRQVKQVRANLEELHSINPELAKDFEAREDVQKLLAREQKGASNGAANESRGNEDGVSESPRGISPAVRAGRGSSGIESGRPEGTEARAAEVSVNPVRSTVPGSHRTTLEVSKAGQRVGEIALSIKGKNASIEWAEVPKSLRGKGHGSKLYDQAIKYAKERGVETLTSDTNGKITPDAERIWKSLVRKGEAEEQVGTPKYSTSLGSKTALSVPSGQIGELRTNLIHQAPGRFQYKLNTDAEGVGQLLKGQHVYNPDLAGTIAVWRDPADGKVYVVNGHHRLELAKRTGQEKVAVRHIVAKDASEARATGALQNIAEGRGTAVDAAKFLRDTGTTVQELERKGISMGEATAAKGVAMAKLDDSLFNKVVQGDMSIERAVAIGEATDDHAEQKAISQLVDKQEAKGKKVSPDTLRELVRFVKGSAKSEETTQSLFGSESIAKSHALEKAEVSAYVKQQLAKDKKLFGFVSKGERAEELERGNNIIDVNASKALADEAAQGEEVYNKLSERAGPIADELDKASARLAGGENANAVKQEAYATIRQALSEALGGGQGAGAEQRQAAATGRAAREASTAAPDETAHYRQTVNGDDLSNWATARDLKIEPQGEQPGLFGGSEKMYRLSRGDSSGNPDRILVTETQLDKLAAEHKNVRLAMQGTEAGGQDSLFGTPSMFGDAKVVPGARSSSTGNETGRSDIQQLTDSIRSNAPEKSSLLDRVKLGQKLGEAQEQGKGAVNEALGRVKGFTAALWDAYKNPRSSVLLPRGDGKNISDYERAVGNWSFADNSSALDLYKFRKAAEESTPDKARRGALGIWMEAGGDQAKLEKWAKDMAGDKKYAPIFDAATKLTDAERTIAQNVLNRNDATLAEMQKAGILREGVENYLMHVWEDNPKLLAQVRAQTNFDSLKLKPSFTKERVIPTYYDGIKMGYTPKDLDYASLTAAHERGLREALAARAFIKELKDGKGADGRPLVATNTASARVADTEGQDPAYFISENAKPGDNYADYRSVDHPSLRGWKWAAEVDGKPVFVQGDLMVHPEVYRHLKNNLTKSAIRNYEVSVGDKTIKPGELALSVSQGIKHTILSLSRFHKTTLEIHALEHQVNPYSNLPELDLSDKNQAALVKGGMMVAHYEGMDAFSDGVASGGALEKIPGVGDWIHGFNERLFKEFMPQLKMKVGLAALDRNRTLYGERMSDEKVAQITAKEMNAAFGGENYRALGRNKTMQDALRLFFMAPDFMEARAKFVGQAMRPEGREQLRAYLLGAAVLYSGARVLNEMLDGKAHWDKPFSVVHRGKEYRLRTVQGDTLEALTNPATFAKNRLSPIASTGIDFAEHKDMFGKKQPVGKLAKDEAKRNVPMPIQPWLKGSKDSNAQKAVESALKVIGVNVRKEQK